jgi:hypothetical protein
VVSKGRDEILCSKKLQQLPSIDLHNEDMLKSIENFPEILRERI